MKPELQQKIDSYLAGKLSPEEIDALWAEMVHFPQALDYLKTTAAAKEIIASTAENETSDKVPATFFTLYNKWIAVAASVLVIITALYLVRKTEPTIHKFDYISYAEMEISDITRSGDSVSDIDSLLNLGIQASIKGHKSKSKAYFQTIIEKYPENEKSAKAYFNLALLIFNEGNYQEAARLFESASELSENDRFFQEKSLWFLANTYINLDNLENARIAAFKAFQIDGDYRRSVFLLLKQLDMKLGLSDFDDDYEMVN